MKKLLFLSNIFTPHQNELTKELKEYCKLYFVFYDYPDKSRGSYWNNEYDTSIVKILSGSSISKFLKIIKLIIDFRPDHILLGGFFIKTNFLIYILCLLLSINVSVLTERLRDKNGRLITKGVKIKLIKFLYSKLTNIFVTEDDTKPQFLNFNLKPNIEVLRYCTNLSFNKDLSIRKNKRILFANRLIEIYNPLYALEIFYKLKKIDTDFTLCLNAQGPLRRDCEKYILKNNLSNCVTFLDDINCWEDVTNLYSECEFLLLPATFSNSNFSIIEGMSAQMKIVISDNVLGIGKFIENGFNGIKLPLDDLNLYVYSILNFNLDDNWQVYNINISNMYSKEAVAKDWYDKL